jgi:hypothetical protein
MEMQMLNNEIRLAYLDWVNNFISIPAFAQYYGISEDHAVMIIRIGRDLHNAHCELAAA